MGSFICKIIGGIFIAIAIMGCLVFLFGLMALLNAGLSTKYFQIATQFFDSFDCNTDCTKIAILISLMATIVSGSIARFIQKRSN